MDGVGYCRPLLRTLERARCVFTCSDPRRDASWLCVLQQPADVWAVGAAQGGFRRAPIFAAQGALFAILWTLETDEIGLSRRCSNAVPYCNGPDCGEVILSDPSPTGIDG